MNKKNIHGWTIVEEISKGSLGTVYKAIKDDGSISAIKHISLPRPTAEVDQLVKNNIIKNSMEANKYFADIIRKEIEIMKKFNNNKYIVNFYDIYQENRIDGSGIDFYIIMEYVEDMNIYFKNKKISIDDVIKVGIDICSALELCSSNNITHNDIKPNNIFIGNDGCYKLGDFSAITNIGNKDMVQFGTYNYVAPEVYEGKEITTSTDLYSLGLVMYKLLNGELPFKTSKNNEEKAFSIRMSGKKVPNIKGVDKKLMNILEKACSFKSTDRYKDATEFKTELEKISKTSISSQKNINFIISSNDDTIGIYEMNEISEFDDNAIDLLSRIKNIVYNKRKLKQIIGTSILCLIILFFGGKYVLGRSCNEGYVNRNGMCVKGYYYCKEGYNLDGNKCKKTLESIDAKVTYTCKAGYILNGDVCVNEDVREPQQVYKCADGFALKGTKCEREESADAVLTYTCPSGYITAGDQCVKVASVNATKSGYTCEDSSYTLSGTTCKKTTSQTTRATISYSCDSGGSLNGTVCTYSTSASWYGWMPSCSQGTYSYLTKMCEYTKNANVIYKCSQGTSDGKGNCISTTTTTKAATAKYSCPSGYTAVGNQCAKTTGIAATKKYICTDDTELRGSKCYATISTDAVSMLDCGEGYIASATGCYKDDFPSAMKKYVCSRVYTLNGDKCEKYEIIAAKAHYED